MAPPIGKLSCTQDSARYVGTESRQIIEVAASVPVHYSPAAVNGQNALGHNGVLVSNASATPVGRIRGSYNTLLYQLGHFRHFSSQRSITIQRAALGHPSTHNYAQSRIEEALSHLKTSW